MIHLTVPGVLDHMREAVAAQGADHIYQQPPVKPPKCRYVWEGCPSCLVGVVLHLAGVPLAAMAEHDPCPVEELLALLARDEVVSYSIPVREVLAAAQDVQDYYHTWGEALAVAERKAAELAGFEPPGVVPS